ncbi:LacI family DNA-binding transcriptional regulator [Lentisphaera profundi]|uniref:LacI family DNA-binding transcriptional regulator n=1 Tax=Lentisphaera profundi TaxID=1658616 RepID=A0ABY7VTC1_9BACT|nr:LacI family DNA-binding transcriptional regulator [Lentisphaera profundi]WDE97461.1 LacI family DNA-binding transcriptional regulator [Lentisphaera profundi]
MNKRVSLQDVAKAAGVSAMTVSRVINNHPRVLEKTAAKVQAVIKELGYSAVPSLRKRGRRSRAHTGIHTGQIALVLLGMDESFANNPVIGKTFHGIRSHLSANEISTVLVPVQDQRNLPDILDRRSIDGMIVTGEFPKESFKKHFEGMPLVYIYCLSNEQEINYDQVLPDNKKVAQLAAKNFLEAGIKHCAFFDPSPNHPEFHIRGLEFSKQIESAGGRVDMYLDKALSESPESAEQDVDRNKFNKMIDVF